jgi:ferritin-like metal-binding protein YciE
LQNQKLAEDAGAARPRFLRASGGGSPMQITTFRDLYLAELQELLDMKRQVGMAHERFAEASTGEKLASSFNQPCEETRQEIRRIETLLRKHGADPEAHHDQAMEALLHETRKMIDAVPKTALRDAALIASGQKIVHYEIAAFGNAAALAGQLGFRDDQKLLHDCVEAEKRADELLTRLAKEFVNPAAVALA